jgi:hypothetical protein
MPFNYQTLKKINSDSISNLALVAANFANTTIPSAKIATGGITSGKLAVGAVDYASNVVTGSVSVSKGGTGLSSVGAANTLLRTNAAANAYEYAAQGFSSMQVFTSNGTWTRPAGVRFIKVKLQAGGGGASDVCGNDELQVPRSHDALNVCATTARWPSVSCAHAVARSDASECQTHLLRDVSRKRLVFPAPCGWRRRCAIFGDYCHLGCCSV